MNCFPYSHEASLRLHSFPPRCERALARFGLTRGGEGQHVRRADPGRHSLRSFALGYFLWPRQGQKLAVGEVLRRPLCPVKRIWDLHSLAKEESDICFPGLQGFVAGSEYSSFSPQSRLSGKSGNSMMPVEFDVTVPVPALCHVPARGTHHCEW